MCKTSTAFLLAMALAVGLTGAPRSVTAQSSAPVAATPQFEVATIKPVDPTVSRGTFFTYKGRHVIASNVSVRDLVLLAYGVHTNQIVNAPTWLATERFDIDGVTTTGDRPNHAQTRLLFQDLLTDRFHFAFHREQKDLPVYALTREKTGLHLDPTDRQPTDSMNFSYTSSNGLTVLMVRNASIGDFADSLGTTFLDRPAIDLTGLSGRYDFTLRWTPDGAPNHDDPAAPPELFTAVREQLGLHLTATKAPVSVLAIDHIARPSAD